MPTTRPRYTITDTGPVRELLDLAQERWPDVTDRRQLLLRLAEAGGAAVAAARDDEDRANRIRRQREAIAEIRELIDVDLLLSDAAWR